MSTAMMVVIAVAVLIVVAVAGMFLYQQVRTQRLRRKFGTEYERTVERAGGKKAAERELREREQRHQALDIRPLAPEVRERYRVEWSGLQENFVDTPESAVADADRLVTLVMRDRGYPTEGFEERIAMLSVEHGRTLDHYHRAHQISERAAQKEAGTEELRQAMVHYRALFEDLLALPDNDRSGERVARGRHSDDQDVNERRVDVPRPRADDVREVRPPVEEAERHAPGHPAREGFTTSDDELQGSRRRPDERN